ncbi:MAG: lysophospholipid acyltransferase family protein [Candidatus Sumerlaeaceae bacterium]|nr:lysophospholipid acyltransferase family protein [Candidatus Sumerlaeaceae bacterium]
MPEEPQEAKNKPDVTSQPTVRLAYRLQYTAYLAVSWLLGRFGRRALIRFSDAIAWVAFSVLRIRRKQVFENLHTAFGDSKPTAELRDIAKWSYRNFALTFLELAHPTMLNGQNGEFFDSPEGMENHAALPPGALIFVTGHFGNWECPRHFTHDRGIKMAVFAKPLHNPLIDAAITRKRQERGLDVIMAAKNPSGAIRALRKGYYLAMLADQDARRQGIFIDFFGKPASTFTGPAFFARRLNIPLMPAFYARDRSPDRRLKLVLFPHIMADPSAPEEQEIERLTEYHVRILEEMVRKYPDNYFWHHRRWKTRPKMSSEF